MTLMDAQQYDERRAHRRHIWIGFIALVVLFLVWFVYHMRNYPERRAADSFFAALQKQDYEGAYTVWQNDPNWKQHPSKDYPYTDFYRDWGPGGEWGLVKEHSVDCSLSTESGVIVQVSVNHRAEHAYVYVLKSNKTLSFSPNEIQCGDLGVLTE